MDFLTNYNFESGTMPLEFSGDWETTMTSPYEGTYCMKNSATSTSSGNKLSETSFRFYLDVGGGDLSFFYRTSSYSSHYLRVYIDGSEVLKKGGENAWAQYTKTGLTAGEHVITFEFFRQNSTSSGANSVYIDNIQITNTLSLPAESGTIDDFETTTRAFSMAGEWNLSTKSYLTGLQSFGSSLASTLNTSGTAFRVYLDTDGEISFYYRVSLADFNDFNVWIDGTKVIGVSGFRGWAKFTQSLTAGEHTIDIEYYKNTSNTNGLEQCFIDQLRVTNVGTLPSRLGTLEDFEDDIFNYDFKGSWSRTQKTAISGSSSFRSRASNTDETSECNTRIYLTAPATLSFYYKVSLADFNDFRFYADGVEKIYLQGQRGWKKYEISLSAGEHVLTWEYLRDTSNTGNSEFVAIDDIHCENVGTLPSPQGTVDDFESVTRSFEFLGDWERSSLFSVSGANSFRSKPSIDTNKASETVVRLYLTQAGEVSFYYRLDCNQYNDFRFYLDGASQIFKSGRTGWQKATYALDAGEHILDFEYHKDTSSTTGYEGVFIDDFQVTNLGILPSPQGEVDNFNTSTRSFAFTGDWDISPQTRVEGSNSFKSAPIASTGLSKVSADIELSQDGEVIFYYKLSASEYNDFLFRIDGITKIDTQFDQGWTKVSYPLTTGVHTLEWEYNKGTNSTKKHDGAFLDLLQITNFRKGVIDNFKYTTDVLYPKRINLSWDSHEDASSYELRRDDTVIYTDVLNSYIDSDVTLDYDTEYTYKVIGLNSNNNIVAEATLTAKTLKSTRVQLMSPADDSIVDDSTPILEAKYHNDFGVSGNIIFEIDVTTRFDSHWKKTNNNATRNYAYTTTATLSGNTSEESDTSSSNMTNGKYYDTSNYYAVKPSSDGNPVYVEIDLGKVRKLGRIVVFHYYGDGRTYNDTKTEISADGISWTTIFDSSVSGTYAETPYGKTHELNGQDVRYIRDYINGSTSNTSNHWVQIQAWGVSPEGIKTIYNPNSLIPKLTSNTSHPPIVVSASNYFSGYDPWEAFNRTDYYTSSWLTTSPPTVSSPHWIKVDFGSGNSKAVITYSIQPSDFDLDESPRSWTFEASDDDVSWTILDTQDDITMSDWNIGYSNFFSIQNETAYRYYRIVFTENNGDNNYLRVGNIEMYEELIGSRYGTTYPDQEILSWEPEDNLDDGYYFWRARAVNDGMMSDWSEIRDLKIKKMTDVKLLHFYDHITVKTPLKLKSDLYFYNRIAVKTPSKLKNDLYFYENIKVSSILKLAQSLYFYEEIVANPYFTSMDLFEDFEDENYVFKFEGDWIRTTTTPYAGSYCYTNKNITDGQSSSFQTIVRTEGGTISFWYRTSTETNLDKLRFYVDDTYVLTASGTTSWTQFTYDLPAGQHTLKWEYVKDGSISSGEDSVYIDNLLVGGVMVWGLGRKIAFFF